MVFVSFRLNLENFNNNVKIELDNMNVKMNHHVSSS